MLSKQISHRAVYTVLRYLGMHSELARLCMHSHLYVDGYKEHSSMCTVDEVFHHEIQFIYPKAYVRDRYYGC
jgi:hypothetical protein